MPARTPCSAALLTSGCALLLSLMLWVNVRAGCTAAAIQLANADPSAELPGSPGGAKAGASAGGAAAGTPLLEQQLKEQQARVRDLEMLLADERSEKQQASSVASV